MDERRADMVLVIGAALAAALAVLLSMMLASCGQPPLAAAAERNARMAEAAAEIDAAAAEGHAATTQAAGLIRSAKTTVDANLAMVPALKPASSDLNDAIPQLEIIDGKFMLIRTQTRVQLVESPKLKADLAAAQAEKDRLEKLWVVRLYKWVVGISRFTFWTTLSLIALVAIMGSIYGIPQATQPAFTGLGKVLGLIGVIAYHVSQWIWSVIPVIGNYIDDFLDWLGGKLHLKPPANQERTAAHGP